VNVHRVTVNSAHFTVVLFTNVHFSDTYVANLRGFYSVVEILHGICPADLEKSTFCGGI
jgi:hypothetical protein